MKIQQTQFNRGSESGVATVMFIALLLIMMILVTAESRALFQLHREVKLLEQQQIKRLDGSHTNLISTAAAGLK